jgi:hypothetical protein
MLPASRDNSPVIILSKVDLPLPFNPIRPILSFGLTNMLAFS